MNGSIIGNIVGISYYIFFQILGLGISFSVLKREKISSKILLGSVVGTVENMWFPALFSFFFGFTKTSHILGLILGVAVFVFIYVINRKSVVETSEYSGETLRENAYLLVVLPVFAFFCYLLYTHTLLPKSDGIHTGQATFGDMNMHLAFITSIKEQGIFPPEYSMLPGKKLGYPFLCETISSSIYLFGSSLRVAYVVPMLFAIMQLMCGVLIFGKELLKSRVKAVLAWFFFIFNGGFGFVYFISGALNNHKIFTRIFTEFYKTPTNYVDKNIRWSNVLIDMLLPQRATLFGYAVLIPVIFLLYRGICLRSRGYFWFVGIIAGGLPMIHTHSFLALGFICAMWLIYSVRTQIDIEWRHRDLKVELAVVFCFYFAMCLIDCLRKNMEIPDRVYFVLGILVALIVTALCIGFVIAGIKKNGIKSIAWNYIILLFVVIVLALPQLIIWTFSQAGGDGFLRGHYNWGNLTDTYLLFYLKNIGIVWIIGLVAIIFTKSRKFFIISPVYFIWSLAELIVFQPNEYDNNKLLYVAYLLLSYFVADYVIEIIRKVKSRVVTVVVMSVIIFFSGFSAVLTMGREMVSDYVLYDANEIEICKYIEKHTKPTDVILTDTRHNNPVVSLTGRNIVCGSSAFLYYHGIDYQQNEEDVREMYMNPDNTKLYDKYNVKYILISESERRNYVIISDKIFLDNFELEKQVGDVSLFVRK